MEMSKINGLNGYVDTAQVSDYRMERTIRTYDVGQTWRDGQTTLDAIRIRGAFFA